jgi:hypothetical protein
MGGRLDWLGSCSRVGCSRRVVASRRLIKRWFIVTFTSLDRILGRSRFCAGGDRCFGRVFQLNDRLWRSWGLKQFPCWHLWLLRGLLCCCFFWQRVLGYTCWWSSWVKPLVVRVCWKSEWEWILQFDRPVFFRVIWRRCFVQTVDSRRACHDWNCRWAAYVLF